MTITQEAAAFFAARLTFQTDVSDVHAALSAGEPGFVLIDSRARIAWDQGHIPGAVHLPTAEIPTRAAELLGLTKETLRYRIEKFNLGPAADAGGASGRPPVATER